MSRLRSGPLWPLLGMGMLVAALLAWTAIQRRLGLSLGLEMRLALALVFGAPLLWMSWVYWRRIDDVAREAQKVATFWGGSFGALVGFMVIAIGGKLGWDFLGLATPGLDPPHLLFHGAVILAGCQMVGFMVVWAWWWWSKR